MKTIRYVTTVLPAAIALTFVTAGAVHADEKADATGACDAAAAAIDSARKAGMLWTTTGPLLKKGKAALDAGDFAGALKACKTAAFQGQASVKQAAMEADAWKTRVPR